MNKNNLQNKHVFYIMYGLNIKGRMKCLIY